MKKNSKNSTISKMLNKVAKAVQGKAKISSKSSKLAKQPKASAAKATSKGKSAASPAPVPAVALQGKGGDKVKKTKQDQVRKQLVKALEKMARDEEADRHVVLTNADGKQYCRAPDCDNVGTTHGYCRLHYIATWKRNKNKLKILSGGMLDKYIEELTSRYPDKYVDIMRKDLSSEKDFQAIISEMELEDSGESEIEDDSGRFMEEVRGVAVPESGGDEEF